MIVAALACIVEFHSLLLGLPGRLRAHAFESGVRRGMTRAEAVALARQTSGYDPGQQWHHVLRPGVPSEVSVEYFDEISLCIVHVVWYQLAIDPEERLESWSVKRYYDGC